MSEKKKKTAQPKPPTSKNLPEERGKETGVVILNILLAIVTVALLGYIAYRNGYIDLDNILNVQEEDEVEQVIQEEEQEEGITLDDMTVIDTYQGEVLSAIVPQDWEIVEYFDGEGSEMIDPGTTYTGLTGIQILNDGEEIMRIEAVSGIGFIGCQELPRFEDSDPEYEAQQEALNEEVFTDEIVYLDFTDTPFSEFHWLDMRMRRIGAALYYDTIENDEYFQPQCEVSFLRLEDLGFEDADGFEGDTYMYTIFPEASEEDLRTLDQILISMMVN